MPSSLSYDRTMNVETVEREELGPDDPTEPVLQVRNVARSFGAVHALRNVDLDVRAGEVVGLLGPNGAGKTTLVHVIATLLDADAGHVSVGGADVATHPAQARRHLGL